MTYANARPNRDAMLLTDAIAIEPPRSRVISALRREPEADFRAPIELKRELIKRDRETRAVRFDVGLFKGPIGEETLGDCLLRLSAQRRDL